MSMKKSTLLSRRSFLMAAGAGAGAAGLAAVLLRSRNEEKPAAPQDPKNDTVGYRETNHVRLYYSTARQ